MSRPPIPTEAQCLAILRTVLPQITTLEMRGPESLDFHTLGVGHIEALIKAAYQQGYEAALPGVTL